MAIIYSYPTSTPASGDLLIGTDITGNSTQNFTVGSVVATGISTHITGTVNKVPLFTGTNVIGDSIVTQSSNKIGIGTASPQEKLDVGGSIYLSNLLDNDIIWKNGTLGTGPSIGTNLSAHLIFKNSSNSAVMTIVNSTGDVGIGTTSPAAKLSVNGKATVTELEVAGASVAGSQFTSLAVKTSTGTEVNTWIDMTATPTSNATGDAYGAVIRAIGSGSNTDKGLVGVNPVGRQSGTGGAEYAYGVLATGEQTGSGNIDFIAGVDARASSSGNGTATTDYIRGVNADAKVNNANATVDYLQGIHAAANLTTGTVGEVNVNLLDWDYTAGTVTGDLSYIRIQNDNYSAVGGTARAIHSLAALPSLFSGTVEVAGGDLEASTVAKGLVLKSPDGTRYRVTVANGGTLSVSAV